MVTWVGRNHVLSVRYGPQVATLRSSIIPPCRYTSWTELKNGARSRNLLRATRIWRVLCTLENWTSLEKRTKLNRIFPYTINSQRDFLSRFFNQSFFPSFLKQFLKYLASLEDRIREKFFYFSSMGARDFPILLILDIWISVPH